MTLFPNLAQVPTGLAYHPGAISTEVESQLAAWIDNQSWATELARRVQHYGWRYDYRLRRVTADSHIGDLPAPLAEIVQRLMACRILSVVPNQAIVNEYLPGQGIAPHIDCEPCFGEEIAMVSLLDSYPMEFAHSAKEAFSILLERRSICVIKGESRRDWTHGISKRKSDPIAGGGRRHRTRRVSITLRSVVLSSPAEG